jgi:hypothetical protein
MNLEKMNLVELNAQEVKSIDAGEVYPQVKFENGKIVIITKPPVETNLTW